MDVGMTNKSVWVVVDEHLASRFGSGLVDVLSTPTLVGFCEECARTMVDPLLPQGQKTVGTSIQLDHIAATPPGMRVSVTAELTDVDRRRLRFTIEAHDEIEVIARASHERFIIDTDRFEGRLRAKVHSAATSDAPDSSS